MWNFQGIVESYNARFSRVAPWLGVDFGSFLVTFCGFAIKSAKQVDWLSFFTFHLWWKTSPPGSSCTSTKYFQACFMAKHEIFRFFHPIPILKFVSAVIPVISEFETHFQYRNRYFDLHVKELLCVQVLSSFLTKKKTDEVVFVQKWRSVKRYSTSTSTSTSRSTCTCIYQCDHSNHD